MNIDVVEGLYENPKSIGKKVNFDVQYENNENHLIPFDEDEYNKIPFNGDGYHVISKRHRDVGRVVCIVCSDPFTLENVEETFDYNEWYKRLGTKISFLLYTPAGVAAPIFVRSNKRRSKKFMDRMYKFAGRVRPQSKAIVYH